MGLQVAPVSGFSTRCQGQRRRAQVRAPVSTLLPPPHHTWAASRPYKDAVIATNSHRLADLGEGGQECWAAALPSSQAQSAQDTSLKAENCHRVPRYH